MSTTFSDSDIIKAARKVALSPKIDLDGISKTKFLNKVRKKLAATKTQSRSHGETLENNNKTPIKLTPTQKHLIISTLQIHRSESRTIQDNDSISRKGTTTMTTSSREMNGKAVATDVAHNTESYLEPTECIDEDADGVENNGELEVDLENGRSNRRNVVAGNMINGECVIFQHDKSTMLIYYMNNFLLTTCLPWFVVTALLYVGFTVLFYELLKKQFNADYFYYDDEALMKVIEAAWIIPFICVGLIAVCFPLAIYNRYRFIEISLDSMHLSVTRIGIQFVFDEHAVWPIGCIVPRRSQTIPFEKITNIAFRKGPVTIHGPCCMATVPFDIVYLSGPFNREKHVNMMTTGLVKSDEFRSLVREHCIRHNKGLQPTDDLPVTYTVAFCD